MTPEEWSATQERALREAGFAVSFHPEFPHFPLVATPRDLTEKLRLLDMNLPLPATMHIAAEGVFVVPRA